MTEVKSMSNSNSIRKIEDHYHINMSTIRPWQMNQLVMGKNPTIAGFKDLMLGDHKFDIENMTEAELTNLRYLTLSTKEVLSTAERKVKTIYYKPRYARLRFLMTYDDFYQACMDKLMLNNGILKFDANYKFECAIQFWFDRVAGWKCKHRAKTADEVTILDKPCSDDSDTTIGDLMLHDKLADEHDLNLDVELRIKRLLSAMDRTDSHRIALKAGDTIVPMSEYTLAKLFMVYHLGKKELAKMMYNTSNNKLVSNQIFNKFYKQMILHVSELIAEEFNSVNEDFSIDINEF